MWQRQTFGQLWRVCSHRAQSVLREPSLFIKTATSCRALTKHDTIDSSRLFFVLLFRFSILDARRSLRIFISHRKTNGQPLLPEPLVDLAPLRKLLSMEMSLMKLLRNCLLYMCDNPIKGDSVGLANTVIDDFLQFINGGGCLWKEA